MTTAKTATLTGVPRANWNRQRWQSCGQEQRANVSDFGTRVGYFSTVLALRGEGQRPAAAGSRKVSIR